MNFNKKHNKSIMWIKQSVKSENRNLTSESDVSSHYRPNDKLKMVTTQQCSYTGDALPPKSFKPWLCFYQLTTQFAHLSNVHHTIL